MQHQEYREERGDWLRGKPRQIEVRQIQIVLKHYIANHLVKSSDVDFSNQVSQALLSLHPQAITSRPAKQVKATSKPRQLQIHWGLPLKRLTSCQCPRVKMSK